MDAKQTPQMILRCPFCEKEHVCDICSQKITFEHDGRMLESCDIYAVCEIQHASFVTSEMMEENLRRADSVKDAAFLLSAGKENTHDHSDYNVQA